MTLVRVRHGFEKGHEDSHDGFGATHVIERVGVFVQNQWRWIRWGRAKLALSMPV